MKLVGNFDAQSAEIHFQETLMFISMKNINMGSLGMLHHHHQNHNINLQQAYLHTKKSTSSLNSFHQLEENFCVYLQAKNQLHPTLSPPPPLRAFLEILQRYAKFLFWVFWASLVGHTQNDSINLQKTSMFICIPKTNFIIHFFLDILHFKESCNFIGCQHFGS